MGQSGQNRQYNHTTGWGPNADGEFSEEPSSILAGVSAALAAVPALSNLTVTAPAGGTVYLSQVIWIKAGDDARITITDSEGAIKAVIGNSAPGAYSENRTPTIINFNPPLNCGTTCVASVTDEAVTGLTLNCYQQLNTNNE